ncbi:LrgB family protein [Dysosmobacter sp.]|uniref:LrgB family protein n=1 Tax=Dysosmobacter sp. TaxID=2591382 RepID=UPI003A9595BB
MSVLAESPFFGIALTVGAYWLGVRIQKRTGLVICNNMIISVVLIIGVLLLFHIPYEAYYEGGSLINMFLGPATTCLAVAIYAKKDLLKRNWLPVLVGCLAGVVVSVGSVWVMCRLFGLDTAMTASLLPKSVTTPIATAVSEGHGGIVSITVAAVIFTGVLGNLIAPFLGRLFRVRDPLAAGLGIGACSHAIGTAKALELGETEGAMSGLAIGVCGIFTALAALFFDALL